MDPELERQLETRTTAAGWTLADLIRCGRTYPSCKVGVHVGDAESYQVFAPLLDRIIADVHGQTSGASGRWTNEVPRIDPQLRDDLAVLSVSVRVTRNLRSCQFPALIGRRARLEVERRTSTALRALGRRFVGQYYSLAELPMPRRRTLEARELCFDGDDRYLEAAGITRDWPEGRGLWCGEDRRLVVWVNEEDHLRFISSSPRGDLASCLSRVRELAWALEDLLGFHHDDRLGYLASCPSNVGTGLRASAVLRLPRLASQPRRLREIVEAHGLDLRGRAISKFGADAGPVSGRDASHQGGSGVFRLSNRRCLGASEVASVEHLADGMSALLEAERSC
ncbi:putative ATP:guanido phosphotransferase YacI [Enhygromyxa salina]|uniref:Putative ATP:guanido phosphotransferase YacI n=1 Tax=Enhygromyxa salina TaxID=215803 RepID=A0A0C2CTW9_9BACT|nr:putative ATP:guanido phosphotransferase YacI [Enhygromyxa salina]